MASRQSRAQLSGKPTLWLSAMRPGKVAALKLNHQYERHKINLKCPQRKSLSKFRPALAPNKSKGSMGLHYLAGGSTGHGKSLLKQPSIYLE